MPRTIQPSFAAGELAPGMRGRVDLSKYSVGAALIKNWIVRKSGGIDTRPGTEFVGEAAREVDGMGGTGFRLIPFQFSVSQAYVLEFSEYCLRVIKDGALVTNPVTDSTRFKWTVSGSGTNEYYLELLAGGAAIYEPSEVEVYVNGLVADKGSIGSLAAGEWGWGDNDALGFSTLYVRLSDGADPDTKATGYVSVIFRTITSYPAADLPLLKYAQSADTLYITHPSYAPKKLTRTEHYVWTFSNWSLSPGISSPSIASAVVSPIAGSPSITLSYRVTAVSATGEESQPSAAQTAAVDIPWASGQTVTVTWNTVTGAVRYNLYKSRRGDYGLIGTTTGVTFIDDNVEAEPSVGFPESAPLFTGTWTAGNIPGVVAFFQQRTLVARTNDQPQTVFGSQTGLPENFFTNYPLQDTNAFEATIDARQINEIRHLVPLKDVLVFTAGGEWLFTNGDNVDALTPTSLKFVLQSEWGCNHLRPVVIGNSVLFVLRSGDRIREFAYDFQSDGFAGGEITVLSDHLFQGYTLDAWAFQKTPYSVLWAVRSDGKLLGLTYLKEHEVWAWHQHETLGSFKDVAVIPDDDQDDEVYFVVERDVGGNTVYFIEKLATRMGDDLIENAWCVDSGLQYSGAAATTISGLDHLEGETVVALADGNVVTGLEVSGGAVTLPHEAEKVTVGLPFTCDFQSLSLDIQDQQGSILPRIRSVTGVVVKFDKSRSVFIGQSFDNLLQFKWRENEAWGEATSLFTGDKEITIEPEWGRDGQICIRQSNPVPATILSISPEMEGADW